MIIRINTYKQYINQSNSKPAGWKRKQNFTSFSCSKKPKNREPKNKKVTQNQILYIYIYIVAFYFLFPCFQSWVLTFEV